MANHLGVTAVAEGVEEVGVEGFLRENGCQAFQGWFYGRPKPLADILLGGFRGSVFP